MMEDQRKFLSDRLFSEELPVTYRLLSRALDLHVNHAKAALYQFHKDQNVRRVNSVFATYLISGTRSRHEQLDADTGSSPDDEGAGYDSPTMTMTLVTEEKLQDVLAEYQQVDSIHVYSLSPHPQRDMALLSDVSKAISEYTGNHDGKVDEAKGVYGSILNPRARRKERKGGPPIPPPSTAPKLSAARPSKAEPAAAPPKATQLGSKAKQEAAETSFNGSTPSSSAAKKPVPTLKHGESGSIMQSFAKAAARPPSQTKPAVKRKKDQDEDEDTAMAMSDDGEADDSDLPAKKPSKDAAAEAANTRSRKDREMELRRMMDEDDDEEDEVAKEEMEEEDEEMAEAEPEAEAEREPIVVEKPSEIVSASSNGRRRGKRRVMKKKRILDDKGYMVTIQEEGWESFSEDEPPPTAPAPKPSTHTSTSTPASTSTGPKAKKNGAKGGAGQGSIMSFFTKK